jgi:GNAT superfamily N-acetyltransferase
MTGRNAVPFRLVPASAEHVSILAKRLRPIDRIECEAMGRSAEEALRHGLFASARTWSALIGDEPHAMFGVVVESVASGHAIPWFLGSDQVARHARLLIARGPAILTAMHRHGSRLCNFVSSENRQAIRLLEHWGFTVEHELVVMRNVAFRRFIREIK